MREPWTGNAHLAVVEKSTLLVLALTVVLAPTAQEPSREERFLDPVRELERVTHPRWYGRSDFRVSAADATGRTERWVPHTPISCGNSMEGNLDSAVAARSGRELCRVWEVEANQDAVAEPGVAVVALDGVEPLTQIGFVLQTRSAVRLEDQDSRVGHLIGVGWKLFVANVREFPLMDGDQFTPTIAFLGGLADHLNRETAGDDVDPSGLLFARSFYHRLPDMEFIHGSVAGPAPWAGSLYRMRLDEPALVRLSFPSSDLAFPDRSAARGDASSSLSEQTLERLATPMDSPTSTQGAPSVLCFEASRLVRDPSLPYGEQYPAKPFARLRVLQTNAAGERMSCEATSVRIFLPSGFDLALPFTVELDLDAGEHAIEAAVRVGGSDRLLRRRG